ncbi:hypothetical protein FisN_18Lh250 [Fistulifera solaris]|uniref:PX domain-containing protein n=1 Tax=Fistulifera solaris TaxID=1519565 RepID=A0A1Z5JU74_FISSO|nr:hypothetical protein FisN_18Lh250 [Fistulifera solaris]|eukprot:GAX17594.1 hypothetical protein FisN_18Lh250 [Fistulifera solaris]
MMTSYESSQMLLREQAQLRAQQMQSASLVSSADDDSFDDNVYTSFPPYPTPSSRRYASTPVSERTSSIVTPQQQVAAARQEWQRHGWTKSQALEDLRSKSSVWVRVTDAVERWDPSGSAYTAYLIQVRQRQQPHQQHVIEHRYSDFYKLHLLFMQNNVKVAFSFPAKQWWKSDQDKIAERLIELDAWIVHVVAEYWNAMNATAYHAVQDFLFAPPSRPCDTVRDVQSASFHPFSRTLVSSQTVQLGAAAGVAVGTAGRTAQSSVPLQLKLHRAHAYAHAHGLFVGVSLEGSWITVRDAVNAKFYGQPCHGGDLLHQAGPPAAEPLYRALDRASQIQIAPDAFRPSEMLNSRNRATPASSWKNAPA